MIQTIPSSSPYSTYCAGALICIILYAQGIQTFATCMHLHNADEIHRLLANLVDMLANGKTLWQI